MNEMSSSKENSQLEFGKEKTPLITNPLIIDGKVKDQLYIQHNENNMGRRISITIYRYIDGEGKALKVNQYEYDGSKPNKVTVGGIEYDLIEEISKCEACCEWLCCIRV